MINTACLQSQPHRRKISLVKHHNPNSYSNYKLCQTLPDQSTDHTFTQSHSNKSKLLFKNLLKQYERILLELDLSHNNISITVLEDILIKMHYLNKLRSIEYQQLLESLYDILNSHFFGVTLTNIFKFLLIIENIEYSNQWLGSSDAEILSQDQRNKPIGVFNCEGDWLLESHQKLGIRKIFQNLYYNRLSRIRVKTVEDYNSYQCKFSPQILQRSKVLAQKQRSKIRSFSKKNLLNSNSHEELLIATKKIKEQNIKHSEQKLQNQEKKKCPFKPKINIRKKSIDQPKDRCIHLFNISKQSLSPTHKPSLEQKQNHSLKQCTFNPFNNSSSKLKLLCMPLAKNSHSSIERIKKGEHMRKMSRTFQERGYPPNVSNWTKFFQNYKKKLQYDPNKIVGHNSSIMSKDPIMTIKVDFSGKEESLDMYEGDSIENLACKILVKNGLEYIHLKAVEQMLLSQIQSHKKICVNNGFVFQIC